MAISQAVAMVAKASADDGSRIIPEPVSFPSHTLMDYQFALAPRRETRHARSILFPLAFVQLGLGGLMLYLILCVQNNCDGSNSSLHSSANVTDTQLGSPSTGDSSGFPSLIAVAILWFCCAGLIAGLLCLLEILQKGYRDRDNYVAFPLAVYYVYEGFVVVGAILSLAAGLHGIYLYNTRDLSLEENFDDLSGTWGRGKKKTDSDWTTFIFGSVVCLIQVLVVAMVQKGLVEQQLKSAGARTLRQRIRRDMKWAKSSEEAQLVDAPVTNV